MGRREELRKIRLGDFLEILGDLELVIGEIEEEEEEWEPLGPLPEPDLSDLRDWDNILLERYSPSYLPPIDLCSMCPRGSCDLSSLTGYCGMNLDGRSGRELLASCISGFSAQLDRARRIVESRLDEEFELRLPRGVEIEAPLARTIVGIRPRRLGDLLKILEYAGSQLSSLASALRIGGNSSRDLASMSLHAGMLGLLVSEVLELVRESERDRDGGGSLEFGYGLVDLGKALILCVGCDARLVDRIVLESSRRGSENEIEVLEVSDYPRESRAKLVGHLALQRRYLRSGLADVVVIGDQCAVGDALEDSARAGIPVISVAENLPLGLDDRTSDDPRIVVRDILEGRSIGALIRDPERAAEIAIEIALRRRNRSRNPEELGRRAIELAKKCTLCGKCSEACPEALDVASAMRSAREGDLTSLEAIYERCRACGECERVCEENIEILQIMSHALALSVSKERGVVPLGIGPVGDDGIREIGRPLVMGEISGIIALTGCPISSNHGRDLAFMARELLSRRYIVVASGCAAIELGRHEGGRIYEEFPQSLGAGGICNLGSCSAISHVAGAAIKVPKIFGKVNLRANFKRIADYILTRVGAAGIAWGPYSQRILALGAGFNRLGIPLVVGPAGERSRRELRELWIYDIRTKERVPMEPAPEFLICSVRSKEEAVVMAAKLCIRPNDTSRGRQIKLGNYIELHEKFFGKLPEDIHLFVRTEADIPIARREEILRILEEEHGWRIDWNRKKILEGPARRYDPSFDPTLLEELLR